MFVYICCSGGATSGFLCVNIVKVAGDEKIYVNEYTEILKDFDSLIQEYDLVLACGPVSLLTKSGIRDYELDKKLNLVLIAPQVRHMKESVATLLEPYAIPVQTIDMKTFGKMDGKKILDDIHEALY